MNCPLRNCSPSSHFYSNIGLTSSHLLQERKCILLFVDKNLQVQQLSHTFSFNSLTWRRRLSSSSSMKRLFWQFNCRGACDSHRLDAWNFWIEEATRCFRWRWMPPRRDCASLTSEGSERTSLESCLLQAFSRCQQSHASVETSSTTCRGKRSLWLQENECLVRVLLLVKMHVLIAKHIWRRIGFQLTEGGMLKNPILTLYWQG